MAMTDRDFDMVVRQFAGSQWPRTLTLDLSHALHPASLQPFHSRLLRRIETMSIEWLGKIQP